MQVTVTTVTILLVIVSVMNYRMEDDALLNVY